MGKPSPDNDVHIDGLAQHARQMAGTLSSGVARAAKRRSNLIVGTLLLGFIGSTYLNTIRRVGTGYDLEAELERELEQEARRQARQEQQQQQA